jgi:hypothetical protein
LYTFWAGQRDEYWQHLVICSSVNLTVAGLAAGQKVELYRASDNYLIGSAIASGSSVAISMDSENFPLNCYLKVYATDAATLIETTSTYEMCGGDTWGWTPPAVTYANVLDTSDKHSGSGSDKLTIYKPA